MPVRKIMNWKLKYQPREWQISALEIWKKKSSGVVSVVTGGGKTIFAQLCIVDFITKNPNGKIFIIVPTTTLLDQWISSLEEELNVSSDEISQFSGEKSSKNISIINVLVINTARSKLMNLCKGHQSMLIVDECHRAGSPVNAQSIKGTFKATLGLSATPERENDDGFYEHISPALGEIIFKYTYKEARKDNVICDFNLCNVHTPMSGTEFDEYTRLTKKISKVSHLVNAGKCSETILKNLLIRRARVSNNSQKRIPVSVKLVSLNPGERTIIFHESIAAANMIVDILNDQGKSVTVYHSKLGQNSRRSNLLNYRKGIFDILVTCRALDEGMNAPETSIAIIASSTSSSRQRIQRLGRVLRPSPQKNSATIYTLFCTDIERQRLKDEESNLSGVSKVKWLSAQ
jgi:superfamily II DNA or RNA helicase